MANFSYNARLTEIIQYILEPIQRQNNIILSLSTWLSGAQTIANTFSESLIPRTQYLANITSSKGAFEWYLNQEFNIATYSPYLPIFIGTIPQAGTDLYGYNNINEVEYTILNFLQAPPPPQTLDTNVSVYTNSESYEPNEIAYVQPSFNPIIQLFTQNYTDNVIPPDTPPFVSGFFINQDKWQIAQYGFNGFQAQTGSEDVDFIVWAPTYLNVGDFDIRITAFVEKYKMAHTTFDVSYYS